MALTLTTEAEIIRRAGAGAPTAITSVSATVVAIGEVAEGEFVADTRRNWITEYANVNASIKKKISAAVASRAAMEIVANNAAGYFNAAEQEVLLSVLDETYNKAVKLLSDNDCNNIRGLSD